MGVVTTWLEALLPVPVTVVSAARTEDPYGQDVADWSQVEQFTTTGWVQPLNGGSADSESLVDRDQQHLDLRVWLPPGTQITGRDRVVVNNESFEVIGPPDRRQTPWTNDEHHVRADLRRVTGPGVANG